MEKNIWRAGEIKLSYRRLDTRLINIHIRLFISSSFLETVRSLVRSLARSRHDSSIRVVQSASSDALGAAIHRYKSAAKFIASIRSDHALPHFFPPDRIACVFHFVANVSIIRREEWTIDRRLSNFARAYLASRRTEGGDIRYASFFFFFFLLEYNLFISKLINTRE